MSLSKWLRLLPLLQYFLVALVPPWLQCFQLAPLGQCCRWLRWLPAAQLAPLGQCFQWLRLRQWPQWLQ